MATKKEESKKKIGKRKTVVKKATPKKATAKKNTVKKAAPKKVAAKKVAAKKIAAMKPIVKKAAPKKVAAKKPAPKKVVAKKPVAAKKISATPKQASPKRVAAKPSVRKPSAIQKATTRAIEPVKQMAAMVPPSPQVEAPKATPVEKNDKAYDPQAIEKKWQAKWEADQLYRAVIDHSKPKHYALTMLPYPSGDLHIGHWYAMTPSDAHARFMRMNGYNVMFPMGFDAFGLPAEGAAIKNNIHPMKWTYANIERMRGQLRSMGAMFDWQREAVSCDPSYYKWTQWFFIQLFKNGLAYRKKSPVDWCPSCNTTLAREQVWGDDRHCERCGTPVIKKELEQWFFKSTQYADELLNFDGMDWPQTVKTLQTNWIDRSEGASVIFKTEQGDDVEVFTTRPDTLWGATFMVFSPEHPLVNKITTEEYKAAVEDYKAQAARQSDIQRGALDKEKTGVFTGAYAINPVNQNRIPIWIADYVLMSYGTGAIMAVPAHDERDFAFAKKYDLPIVEVIRAEGKTDEGELQAAYAGAGVMVNSAQFNGTPVNTEKGRKNPGIAAVIDWLQTQGIGKQAVNYKYRDWLISRQRYWGAPIPMVRCETHGWNPVPDEQLPVTLPDDVAWKPTGESPLKLHATWKNAACPVCGAPAERETDTMDTFMCSSWYHLRYLSPKYDQAPFDPAEYDYWMPVDTYTGGSEHATMHLLYTRFFHKAMRDAGITKGKEPMTQLRNQGMVLGEDNEKMSKSRGNVIAPDVLVNQYGADTVRAYLMFFARWQMGAPWDSKGIEGSARWVRRTWTIFTDEIPANAGTAADEVKRNLRRRVHQTLRKVTRDFETFEFNTIISSLMELMNEMYKAREAGAVGTPEWREAQEIYLKMMAPVAPHIAEELWTNVLGLPYSVHTQAWHKVDEEAAKDDSIEIPVQVNGKLRAKVTVPADASEDEIKSAALEAAQKHLEGKEPRKVIVANKRLVNIVI
ncbi:MAG: leucine--tRNA ligase [Anaerolineales bacterium]